MSLQMIKPKNSLRIERKPLIKLEYKQALKQKLEENSNISFELKDIMSQQFKKIDSLTSNQALCIMIKKLRENIKSMQFDGTDVEKLLSEFLNLTKSVGNVWNLKESDLKNGTNFLFECQKILDHVSQRKRQKVWKNLIEPWKNLFMQFKLHKKDEYWMHSILLNFFNFKEHFQQKQSKNQLLETINMIKKGYLRIQTEVPKQITVLIEKYISEEFSKEKVDIEKFNEIINKKEKTNTQIPKLKIKSMSNQKQQKSTEKTSSRTKLPILYFNRHSDKPIKFLTSENTSLKIERNQNIPSEELIEVQEEISSKTKQQQISEIYNLKLKMMICARTQNSLKKQRKLSYTSSSVMRKKSTNKLSMTKRRFPVKPKEAEKQKMTFEPIKSNLYQKKLTFEKEFFKITNNINHYFFGILQSWKYKKLRQKKIFFLTFWKNIKRGDTIFFKSFMCNVLRKVNEGYCVKLYLKINRTNFLSICFDMNEDEDLCLKKFISLMNSAKKENQACISHLYCGKIDFLSLEYIKQIKEKEQLMIGAPSNAKSKFSTAMYIQKKNQTKRKMIKRALSIYGNYFLEYEESQSNRKTEEEFSFYNILILNMFFERKKKITINDYDDKLNFSQILNSMNKNRLKIAVKSKRSWIMMKIDIVSKLNDVFLVLRVAQFSSIQEISNFVILLEEKCLLSHTKLYEIENLAKESYRNVSQLKNSILKKNLSFDNWKCCIFNQVLLRIPYKAYMIKSQNKQYFQSKIFSFNRQNIFLIIHESSKNRYFSLISWEAFFMLMFKDFTHLFRSRKKKSPKNKTQKRNESEVLDGQAKIIIFNRFLGDNVIKKYLKIIYDQGIPIFMAKKLMIKMFQMSYYWIDKNELNKPKFCFSLKNHKLFTVSIKDEYVYTEVFPMKQKNKEEKYRIYRQFLANKLYNFHHYVIKGSLLCKIQSHNHKLQIFSKKLSEKMELNHPVQYLSSFSGEARKELKKKIYQNKKMMRRSLKVIGKEIFLKIKSFENK